MDTSERILLALGDIREDVGAMGADIRSVDKRLDALEQVLKDHVAEGKAISKRVSSLEHSRTRMTAIAGLVSAAVSGLAAIGTATLKGYPWAH
ncbi:MAG: hypothetical protein EPO10_14610 [Reyranella sp.]|uniref:hypothetical protein n=1 Tax=Reyranella sp. TaxID=1929291 RepID=UPI00121A506D|nr:hypothetical protein [Reyranella sp.]TAJ97155.1 MAG: hypothetical protein EPO41_03955 [Reyranella sp.]TBR28126.1 MAG: hypothetical protein EPO10_14610 [Reyranella sp.]